MAEEISIASAIYALLLGMLGITGVKDKIVY